MVNQRLEDSLLATWLRSVSGSVCPPGACNACASVCGDTHAPEVCVSCANALIEYGRISECIFHFAESINTQILLEYL